MDNLEKAHKSIQKHRFVNVPRRARHGFPMKPMTYISEPGKMGPNYVYFCLCLLNFAGKNQQKCFFWWGKTGRPGPIMPRKVFVRLLGGSRPPLPKQGKRPPRARDFARQNPQEHKEGGFGAATSLPGCWSLFWSPQAPGGGIRPLGSRLSARSRGRARPKPSEGFGVSLPLSLAAVSLPFFPLHVYRQRQGAYRRKSLSGLNATRVWPRRWR